MRPERFYACVMVLGLCLSTFGCGTSGDEEEFTMGGGSGTSSGVGFTGSGGRQNMNDDASIESADMGPDAMMPISTGLPMDLPPDTACDVIDGAWPEEWVEFEDAVLAITNEYRAQSIDCRTGGLFPPALPLEDAPLLRCAARRHSLDMVQRNYFNHVSPDGVPPPDRVVDTGYSFRAVGENIAAGQMTPQAVVDGWIASDGHCANLMSPNFEELGTGYVKASMNLTHYWTQVFGTPN